MKKIINTLFGFYKENGQIIVKIFGIKIKFKSANINQLEEACCIQNLAKLKEQNTYFPHPVGIVIHPNVKIGKNCTIFQNVTVGSSRITNSEVPTIGNNVTIYANATIFGNIKIGNNVTIGAGSVVFRDIPDNTTAVGNPAQIIKQKIL